MDYRIYWVLLSYLYSNLYLIHSKIIFKYMNYSIVPSNLINGKYYSNMKIKINN